jgi:hypothetical protein
MPGNPVKGDKLGYAAVSTNYHVGRSLGILARQPIHRLFCAPPGSEMHDQEFVLDITPHVRALHEWHSCVIIIHQTVVIDFHSVFLLSTDSLLSVDRFNMISHPTIHQRNEAVSLLAMASFKLSSNSSVCGKYV